MVINMEFEKLRIKDIDVVVRYKAKPTQFYAKYRKNHIIGVKLCGKAYHDFGYQQFTLTENSIYFFNQKDDYFAHIQEEGEVFSVHFTTYEPIETDSFCINIKNRSEIYRILEQIESKNTVSSRGDSEVMSLMYKLCGMYSDIKRKKYTPENSRMEEARQYIDMHFKENDCIDEAVKIYGTSRRRFNDVFKIMCNTTPNRYVVIQRIEYAKELLKSGYMSVGETAKLCGFSDICYFSKVFKTETGKTPAEYKKT